MSTIQSVDAVFIIEAIKKQPILYNRSYRDRGGDVASNVKAKQLVWRQVTKELYQHYWDELIENQQLDLIKDTQVKWKSLRDHFVKVLRRHQNNDPDARMKRYRYFEELEFLAPFCQSRRSTGVSAPNTIYLTENTSIDSNYDDDDAETEENTLDYFDDGDAYAPSKSLTENEPRVEIELQPTEKKMRIERSETPSAEDKQKDSNDPMDNKSFLLSMLPFMKRLPDDVNLEVRLQLMSVLQQYSCKSGRLL